MASETIRVAGLRELQRDFRKLESGIGREVRTELRKAAEPVRTEAQSLAASSISHIGTRWYGMKVGVTTRSVYVAPSARRSGGSARPNLGGLLMKKAMLPALEQKAEDVEQAIDRLLGRLAGENGF